MFINFHSLNSTFFRKGWVTHDYRCGLQLENKKLGACSNKLFDDYKKIVTRQTTFFIINCIKQTIMQCPIIDQKRYLTREKALFWYSLLY